MMAGNWATKRGEGRIADMEGSSGVVARQIECSESRIVGESSCSIHKMRQKQK